MLLLLLLRPRVQYSRWWFKWSFGIQLTLSGHQLHFWTTSCCSFIIMCCSLPWCIYNIDVRVCDSDAYLNEPEIVNLSFVYIFLSVLFMFSSSSSSSLIWPYVGFTFMVRTNSCVAPTLSFKCNKQVLDFSWLEFLCPVCIQWSTARRWLTLSTGGGAVQGPRRMCTGLSVPTAARLAIHCRGIALSVACPEVRGVRSFLPVSVSI